MDFQTELENEACRLFAQTHPVLFPIAEHLQHVSKRERDWTGVGFYTKLTYTPGLAPLRFLSPWSFTCVIDGECNEMPEGFSILFHLKDGFLSTIEGLSNEGEWKIESASNLHVHPVDREYRFLQPPYLTGSIH